MDNFFRVPANEMTNQADFHRPHYQVVVPNSVTLEDVLRPVTWVHHAFKFAPTPNGNPRRFGVIEVMSEDGLLEVHLRVLGVVDGLLRVRAYYHYEDPNRVLDKPVEIVSTSDLPREPTPEGYKIGFAPATGYWVKLDATNEIIFRNLHNHKMALERAVSHAKAAGTYTEPEMAEDA